MDGLCFNCGSHLPAGSPLCPMCGALGNVEPLKAPEWGQILEGAMPASGQSATATTTIRAARPTRSRAWAVW